MKCSGVASLIVHGTLSSSAFAQVNLTVIRSPVFHEDQPERSAKGAARATSQIGNCFAPRSGFLKADTIVWL
jgi:hypothetical protein